MKKLLIILSFIFCGLLVNAQQKISAMTSATTLTGSEYLPVVQSSVNKKVTPLVLSEYISTTIDTNVFATVYDVTVVQSQISDTITLTEAITAMPGIVLPGLTAAQIAALTNMVAGTFVFNTTDNQLYYYNGTTWNALSIAN